MVHHVFLEHFECGAPFVGRLVSLLEVGKHHLDLLVLFDRLQHQVTRRLCLFGGRVEDLLLDLSVDRQLAVQLWEESLPVVFALHRGEDLLHRLVVVFQQFDSIHAGLLVTNLTT